MSSIKRIADVAGGIAELLGVTVVLIGMVIATVRLIQAFRRPDASQLFKSYRHDLGKAILLGLEFLVAGDIIRTVAVDPTLRSSLVLGIIVLIRTFLSISLQVELEGRWPWQGS